MDNQGKTHTQGEWKLSGFEQNGDPPSDYIGYRIYDEKDFRIAFVDGEGRMPWEPNAEGLANAQLIASAPLLLEACEEALTMLREYGYGGKVIKQLESAIKSAKGL